MLENSEVLHIAEFTITVMDSGEGVWGVEAWGALARVTS